MDNNTFGTVHHRSCTLVLIKENRRISPLPVVINWNKLNLALARIIWRRDVKNHDNCKVDCYFYFLLKTNVNAIFLWGHCPFPRRWFFCAPVACFIQRKTKTCITHQKTNVARRAWTWKNVSPARAKLGGDRLATNALQPTNKRAAKTTNGQRSTLYAPLGSMFEAQVLIEQTQSSFRIYKLYNVGQIECEKLRQHRIPEVCVHSNDFPRRQALQHRNLRAE